MNKLSGYQINLKCDGKVFVQELSIVHFISMDLLQKRPKNIQNTVTFGWGIIEKKEIILSL